MENTTICIASLPQRGFLNETVKSLLKEPQLYQIIVSLNNYTDDDCNDLLQDKKVIYHRTNNEKGCSEKLRFIKDVKTKYLGFADDDFTVKKGYLSGLIKGLNRHPDSIVSYTGKILNKGIISNFYIDCKGFHCRTVQKKDVMVDVIGSGVCLFKKTDDFNGLYDKVVHPNMTDIYLSGLAKALKMERWLVKHPHDIVVAKPYNVNDNYIFAKHKYNCQPQTDFINKYFL